MMLITAIVVPSRVPELKRVLGLFGVQGLSQSQAFVDVRAGARVEVYRGVRWEVSMAPRIRLEVLSANADVPDLVRVISRAVHGSDIDLWVTRVDHLVRIRTGEVGLDAL